MPCNRNRPGSGHLAIPARDPRQAVRNVLDLDVERGGVQQVKPPAAQHPVPDRHAATPRSDRD